MSNQSANNLVGNLIFLKLDVKAQFDVSEEILRIAKELQALSDGELPEDKKKKLGEIQQKLLNSAKLLANNAITTSGAATRVIVSATSSS